MEVSITAADIDDARDLFLLAKDRLLDVNDWNYSLKGNYRITLTDAAGHKLQRIARVGDMLCISAGNEVGIGSEMWIRISRIQYDFFPDVLSESISMLLETAHSPTGNATGSDNMQQETILIKREGPTLTAHCNAGNELPETNDEDPNAHLNRDAELHPVLSIPQGSLQQLLSDLIEDTGEG